MGPADQIGQVDILEVGPEMSPTPVAFIALCFADATQPGGEDDVPLLHQLLTLPTRLGFGFHAPAMRE